MSAIDSQIERFDSTRGSLLSTLAHQALVVVGATVLTTAIFLVLPVIQAISGGNRDLVQVKEASYAVVEPPPQPPEDEPEEEEEEVEEEPPPPQNQQLLSLDQLEIALSDSLGFGGFGEGFDLDLGSLTQGAGGLEALFGGAGMDTGARAIYQAQPKASSATATQAPGRCTVRCIVDAKGKVTDVRVESSSHKVFERPSLEAARQWRFEPAKREGEPVEDRISIPFFFPKQ